MAKTCVIVGGGYAGIHAVQSLQKAFRGEELNLVLIDKNPYHTRKVLLFKPAVNDEDIKIPFRDIFPSGVDFLQACVQSLEHERNMLRCLNPAGETFDVHYDYVVLAAGSVVRETETDKGGIALNGIEAAQKINKLWRANLKAAVTETDTHKKQSLMTITIAGAGLSGIETAAELVHSVRAYAKELGLEERAVKILLMNAHERLFMEGPSSVSDKLERSLREAGVTVCHQSRVMQATDGKVHLADGKELPSGLCLWTLGLQPNPMLKQMNVPLTEDGKVAVDHSYRVKGLPGVYSVGDCAHIVDAVSGKPDRMTCKEAGAQSARLGQVILADTNGTRAPVHKSYMDTYCWSIGPDNGMAWASKWGLSFVVAGKWGLKMRKFTWDIASLLRN
ncbi:NAD(P)/FAD-dependent oxidoreductase [Fictibacillus iocasae]|uniref:NADH:ubiquinone reductase (non-electrogenic) n=1 Tax=Fictibacillus iocasae TaxID=2715437 RepID=A0ABW2NRF9_9BACL